MSPALNRSGAGGLLPPRAGEEAMTMVIVVQPHGEADLMLLLALVSDSPPVLRYHASWFTTDRWHTWTVAAAGRPLVFREVLGPWPGDREEAVVTESGGRPSKRENRMTAHLVAWMRLRRPIRVLPRADAAAAAGTAFPRRRGWLERVRGRALRRRHEEDDDDGA